VQTRGASSHSHRYESLRAACGTGREPLNTAVAEIQEDRRQQVRDRTDRSLAARMFRMFTECSSRLHVTRGAYICSPNSALILTLRTLKARGMSEA
jgi:hypothetical protein